MRTRWAMAVLPAAVLVAVLAARSSAAPTRKKLDCAAYRADVEQTTKAIGHPMKIKAGDWANTPAALRVLPPKAEMCGSMGNTVFVASPLFGKELEAHYRPILEKLGCKDPKCEVSDKKSICSCRAAGGLARVGTEERIEAYGISWIPLG